jgi:predicted metal-dependent enzyme (double-stranded beta helix superfamily)
VTLAADVSRFQRVTETPYNVILKSSARTTMNTGPKVTTSPILAELISSVREASAADDFRPEQVRDLLTNVLSRGDDWLDRKYQTRHGEPKGKLYPLFRAEDRRCSILVAVFEAGVPAPVHNHGSWAVVGVYRGRERETWFRRLDDGSSPGRADLEVQRTWVNTPGTVNIVPDGTIHTVEAIDGQDAVSIHIYGTDIVTQERSSFNVADGTEEAFSPPFSPTDD